MSNYLNMIIAAVETLLAGSEGPFKKIPACDDDLIVRDVERRDGSHIYSIKVATVKNLKENPAAIITAEDYATPAQLLTLMRSLGNLSKETGIPVDGWSFFSSTLRKANNTDPIPGEVLLTLADTLEEAGITLRMGLTKYKQAQVLCDYLQKAKAADASVISLKLG